MSDYQSIVDEIRFAIQSEDCELTDNLRQVNLQYIEACREVNRQLRRVNELLSLGLRSEAIHFAEGPPNLTELASILLFAEVDEWNEVLSIYDLPQAEKLSLDVIERLTEAEISEHPLQQLLARHRRLALARAPLSERLNVLRQLARTDVDTFVWQEDVLTFERARFEEMAIEAKKAEMSADVPKLKQILKELKENRWLQNPPKKLYTGIQKSLAGMSRRSARQRIQQLAEELESAFSELDVHRARELRNQWHEATREADMPPSDPVFEQVNPILGWIQDEDGRELADHKFAQAVKQLETALDEDPSIEQLERIEGEIHRLNRDIPTSLAKRSQHRIETLRLADTRRHRLQLGGIVAVLVVVAVFVAFLVSRQVQTNEVVALATHVEQLLENRLYEQASIALNSREDIAKWENLLSLQSRLASEVQQDQERASELNLQFERAQTATTFSMAMTALERAKELLSTPDEQLKYEQIKRERENLHNQEIAEKESQIRSGIQSVTTILVEVEDRIGDDPTSELLNTKLNDAANSLNRLKLDSRGLQAELGSQIQLLINRQQQLKSFRDKKVNRLVLDRDLVRRSFIAFNSINIEEDVNQYRDALSKYADSLDPGPTADYLRTSAEESFYWQAAMEWAQFTSHMPVVWPTTHEMRSTRIDECQEFLKRFPGAPDAETIQQYIAQLNSMQERVAPSGESRIALKDQAERLFASRLIGDSWCLRTSDDRVFYLLEEKKVNPHKLFTFHYLVGYGSDDLRQRGDVKPTELLTITAQRSPCSKVADWSKTQLRLVNVENWNQFLLDLAVRLRDEDELNPFLKLDLIRRTLELASAGDVFLKTELAQHLQLLQNVSINPLARWMDPDDEEGRKAISVAKTNLSTFERLPRLEDVWNAAAEQQERLAMNFGSALNMVGWARNREGIWECESVWEPKQNWDLLVVYCEKSGETSQWRKVGEGRDNTFQLQNSSFGFLQDGRPIFARKQGTHLDHSK